MTGLAGDMQAIEEVLNEEQWKAFQNPIAIELAPGHCTFHHPLMVHGSFDNKTEIPRRAVVLNVIRDGVASYTDDPLLEGIPPVPQGEKMDGQFFPLLYGRELKLTKTIVWPNVASFVCFFAGSGCQSGEDCRPTKQVAEGASISDNVLSLLVRQQKTERTSLPRPSETTGSDVDVNLDARSYSIEIAPGNLEQLAILLQPFLQNEHVIVVTDDNVEKHYLAAVIKRIGSIATRIDSIVVPHGEPSKSVSSCDGLWQKMVQLGTDRKSYVVALGGGVVGDLAGFLAATYGRGLKFIQIPTSLLAQVDSSVGGKVGINLPQAKNMVGAFWQPEAVVIDPLVLKTLDEPNYCAGMAEVIKYGLIMDLPLFEFLESCVEKIKARDSQTLTEIISWCCQCKATVVEEDEKETSGRRAILNYGHTFGHAIEAVFGYGEFLHGQAISIGMTCAGRLARNMGRVDQAFLDRQTKLFTDVGLPVICPSARHDELVEAMKHDKKVARGKLVLILPTKIGHVEEVNSPSDELLLESLKND